MCTLISSSAQQKHLRATRSSSGSSETNLCNPFRNYTKWHTWASADYWKSPATLTSLCRLAQFLTKGVTVREHLDEKETSTLILHDVLEQKSRMRSRSLFFFLKGAWLWHRVRVEKLNHFLLYWSTVVYFSTCTRFLTRSRLKATVVLIPTDYSQQVFWLIFHHRRVFNSLTVLLNQPLLLAKLSGLEIR